MARALVLVLLLACSSGSGPPAVDRPSGGTSGAGSGASGGATPASGGAGGAAVGGAGGTSPPPAAGGTTPATDTRPADDTSVETGAPDLGSPMAPAGLGPVGFTCPAGATYGPPVADGARATTIHTGFLQAEGPIWIPAHGVLLVSDINENRLGEGRILKHTPPDRWETFVMKVGTNGLALDVDGRVVAASHDLASLTRFHPVTGERSPVTGSDAYQGKPFNEINDVVVRTDGNMYFTDPRFQPGAKGRAGQGVTAYYRLSPAGVATRIATHPAPNGIALSPDGRWLYVSGGAPLRRHAVADDGAVTPESTTLNPSGSDGMGVDCAGNLYLTQGGGVKVLAPDGKQLAAIAVPSSGFITNVAFGGPDRRTLYVTTKGGVHSLRVEVPGFPN